MTGEADVEGRVRSNEKENKKNNKTLERCKKGRHKIKTIKQEIKDR